MITTYRNKLGSLSPHLWSFGRILPQSHKLLVWKRKYGSWAFWDILRSYSMSPQKQTLIHDRLDVIHLPSIGNSLKKQKSLYKVLTLSIKPPYKFLWAYASLVRKGLTLHLKIYPRENFLLYDVYCQSLMHC